MTRPGKAEKLAARSARLAAALRENLKRRKAQARRRANEAPTGEDLPADDAKIDAAPDFRRNQVTKSGDGSGGPGMGGGG